MLKTSILKRKWPCGTMLPRVSSDGYGAFYHQLINILFISAYYFNINLET